mmetsp:Transcript_48503/g.110143  ORF Transcript_48503/g.110143 Transcript_48503/m.110143 type:complete len:145 (+) Transcript_48503:869-1303(+)
MVVGVRSQVLGVVSALEKRRQREVAQGACAGYISKQRSCGWEKLLVDVDRSSLVWDSCRETQFACGGPEPWPLCGLETSGVLLNWDRAQDSKIYRQVYMQDSHFVEQSWLVSGQLLCAACMRVFGFRIWVVVVLQLGGIVAGVE